MRKDTVLVSIMYANNEIGTIQPIKEAAKIIRDFRKRNNSSTPFFHTDAVQAAGYLDMNVQKLGVDLMTVNASKIYGPKGIGFLYIRRGVKLAPILYGGGQERGLRPGTENIPGIVGLSKAFEISQKTREKESKRLIVLRDYLIRNILKKIPDSVLNGHPVLRLPNNVNITIRDIEGESWFYILMPLALLVRPVLPALRKIWSPLMSLPPWANRKKKRIVRSVFTLGRKTGKTDIDYVLKVLPAIVKKLRSISAIKYNEKN